MAAQDQNKRITAIKWIGLAILWAIIWLPLRGEWYEPLLKLRFSASTAFVLWFVFVFISSAIVEIGFVVLLAKREKAINFRQFFRIERLDVFGIWLTIGLGFVVQQIT